MMLQSQISYCFCYEVLNNIKPDVCVYAHENFLNWNYHIFHTEVYIAILEKNKTKQNNLKDLETFESSQVYTKTWSGYNTAVVTNHYVFLILILIVWTRVSTETWGRRWRIYLDIHELVFLSLHSPSLTRLACHRAPQTRRLS